MLYYVIDGKRQEKKMRFKRSRGEGRHPLYNRWRMMKARCYNTNNKDYPNYGGRGITVYPLWLNNSALFISYIESLPNVNREGYTLDRIHNEYNYEPMNLRWANRTLQSRNRRPRVDGKTGYYRVSSLEINGQVKYKAVYILPSGKKKCFTASTAELANARREAWEKVALKDTAS